MRCSSLCPTRWPTRVFWYGYVPTAALQAEAAVMQVRPLSVVSGTAGSSPFGRSPFGPLGWL